MKAIYWFLFLNLVFSACTLSERIINADEVVMDSTSNILLFRMNKERITGVVVGKCRNEWLEATIQRKTVVEDGVIKEVTDYYQSGELFLKRLDNGHRIQFYSMGGLLMTTILRDQTYQDSIRFLYDSNGRWKTQVLFDWEKKEKTIKEYKRGVQYKETVYTTEGEGMGEVIRSYDFDDDGNKIIPDIEKLELLTYKTGFYRHVDYNQEQVLFQPMVLMKWKNISGEALTNKIEITGVFISGSEEWSTDDTYFQTSYSTPLQSGLTRQAAVTSSVGYRSVAGIVGASITCQIYINKQLYKTIRIQNKQLHSNRIQ